MRTRVIWRTPRWARDKFVRLTEDYDQVDPESDIGYAIRDEIRSLPGFPHSAPEDAEFIVEVTSLR